MGRKQRRNMLVHIQRGVDKEPPWPVRATVTGRMRKKTARIWYWFAEIGKAKSAHVLPTQTLSPLSLVCSPWGRVSCVNNNKEELRGEQKDTPGGGSCAHFPPNWTAVIEDEQQPASTKQANKHFHPHMLSSSSRTVNRKLLLRLNWIFLRTFQNSQDAT